MTAIQNFFQNLLYQIPKIGISDIIDILVVSFLIYTVLRLVRSSSAARVAWTVLVLLIATWLTSVFDLYACNWILNKILELGFISLVVIFQPEIRRAMERFGGKFFLNLVDPASKKSVEESTIEATVSACEIMSKERVGVLLIFERSVSLEEYFKTGTLIDAKVTEQLLRNLFFPKASLHDGAVIVRGGRIAAAGCVMPLSENTHLSSDLGTRHRAGIGTSEVSDAVVVIVSEETGTISVAIGGMLKRHLAPQTLEKLLSNELMTNDDAKRSLLDRLRARIAKAGNYEKK
ncbi:MAG: TIGR00159 family protein [Clostridia bacterium]|nr:MAG: TIGR00159 family protein [Clostridia bacterium]